MTDTVTILKAARDLIAKPENWEKGLFSNVKDGNRCYCAAGAIYHSLGISIYQPLPREFVVALGFENESDIFVFNDHANHEEVLGRFSKAITAAEEAGR